MSVLNMRNVALSAALAAALAVATAPADGRSGSSAPGEHPGIVTAAKSDRLDYAPEGSCPGQAWPHVLPVCLSSVDGEAPRHVRAVTVERLVGPDASELVREPAAAAD